MFVYVKNPVYIHRIPGLNTYYTFEISINCIITYTKISAIKLPVLYIGNIFNVHCQICAKLETYHSYAPLFVEE